MWILYFELVLLTPEMEIQDDLFLQVVKHLVPNFVCFFYLVSDGRVTRVEVI